MVHNGNSDENGTTICLNVERQMFTRVERARFYLDIFCKHVERIFRLSLKIKERIVYLIDKLDKIQYLVLLVL